MRNKTVTWITRPRVALLAGLTLPPAACSLLSLHRSAFPGGNSALLLVVIVVAIAAFGSRLGALAAAVSGAIWFDYFLTPPYHRFAISSRSDVETTVLLVIVGAAVTELAIWGRRQQDRAHRHASYLIGLHDAAEVIASGGSPTQLADRVASLLSEVLGLRTCEFRLGVGGGTPRLQHDGSVTWGDMAWDVDHEGLPQSQETELVVSVSGRVLGRFLMKPDLYARPSLTQRLVAVSLADQVGGALSEYHVGPPTPG